MIENAVEEQTDNGILTEFGENLTERYRAGKLEKIFNRDSEVEELIRVLIKKQKPNAILIGNAGVGKTSLINLLIEKIENCDVPYSLMDKEIISINTGKVVSGTKFRGQMEERMTAVIEEAKHRNCILFIDEIHTSMQSAGEASSSLADIIKPYLTNGDIQVIGTLTFDDHKDFRKDKAFARRFQKITINEPSIEDCKIILEQAVPYYAKHHALEYPKTEVDKIPSLVKKYMADRFLPDAAFDILDEVGANIRKTSRLKADKNQKFKEELTDLDKEKYDILKREDWAAVKPMIDRKDSIIKKINNTDGRAVSNIDILQVVSTMSGVPLDDMNSNGFEKVQKLEKDLKRSVIGQEEAIEKLVKSLKRTVIDMNYPNKPICSAIFNGVTGSGKTYLAQELSRLWYRNNLIRIDMSEYQEKHSVSNLIGTSAGYTGYDDGGKLTEEVRNNPYSIVLLDEIEKAHKDVTNILLQILDNGFITDNKGEKVDFRNTIIIMTANLGAKKSSSKNVGYGGGTKPTLTKTSKEAITKHFTHEFLNRVDHVVVFNRLSEENISVILDREIEKVNDMLSPRDTKIKITSTLKTELIAKGFNDEMGARPLKREVEKIVIDPLVDYIASNNFKGKLTLSFKDKLVIKEA